MIKIDAYVLFKREFYCIFSDYNSLNEADVCRNNQLAFDKAQEEFGISPVMTGEDMANCEKPDKLTIVSYLSQFHDIFKKQRPPSGKIKLHISCLINFKVGGAYCICFVSTHVN